MTIINKQKARWCYGGIYLALAMGFYGGMCDPAYPSSGILFATGFSLAGFLAFASWEYSKGK